MLKLIPFVFFIFLFPDLQAQHSYTTLKIEHQFNALQNALKNDPNNDTLILKKLCLVADRTFIYEDQAQEYTFNFERYDYEQRLADINKLLAKEKTYTISDTLYQYLDLMFLRAQIHLSEAKDENATADYKSIIVHIQNNKYTDEVLNNTLTQINDYFQVLSFYTEDEDSINYYKQQHLNLLNQMLIVEKTKQFDKNNPILLLELNYLAKTKANLLKELEQTQQHIAYLRQLLPFTYEYILDLKAQNNPENTFLIEQNQNDLFFYAYELAQTFYSINDFKNAQAWAQAYLKDMYNITSTKSAQDLLFYNLIDYSYQCHELLYNIALADKKQDLKLILKHLSPMLNNVHEPMDYDTTILESQIKTLIDKYPKSGELYALYALFKCKNRYNNYHLYATYGKEILALLDKAQSLSYTLPNANFIKAIVYIEFENDKELGAFHLEKALKENPDYYYYSLEYLDHLQLNHTNFLDDDNIVDEFTDTMEYYNLPLPQNIIQLIYKK